MALSLPTLLPSLWKQVLSGEGGSRRGWNQNGKGDADELWACYHQAAELVLWRQTDLSQVPIPDARRVAAGLMGRCGLMERHRTCTFVG